MSEVTICNLTLAHLGDVAMVASIKPPDSSVQAQLCARFYYVARNALLEMSAWGFATRRVRLAAIERPEHHHTWRHVYRRARCEKRRSGAGRYANPHRTE